MFQGQKSNEKREYNQKGYIYIYIYIYIYYLKKKYTMYDFKYYFQSQFITHAKDGIYKSKIKSKT